MEKIVILSGAGISAESGISTFRDADGLWEGHDVMSVASPEGWENNKELVLDFYNQRRKQLQNVSPNAAHLSIAMLEKKYNVVVVTQNVDDLHERGGSTKIIHLHGELKKARSTQNYTFIIDWMNDLNIGDMCPNGFQLRPHIVWFGEMVPMLEPAIQECQSADIILIVGTSMQVYPAAGLVQYAKPGCKVYYIDPKPNISYELKRSPNLQVIEEPATIGVVTLVEQLLN